MNERRDPDQPGDLRAAVRNQILWLENWVTRTTGLPLKDERGNVYGSASICPIPDWEVRQRLQWLREDLAAAPASSPDLKRAIAEMDRLREMLGTRGHVSCGKCGGSGVERRWNTTYETDDTDERANAWYSVCCECTKGGAK